ncbi:hypothetical protein BH23ACT9_BH23ACT9_05370 [soil metagenome]
MNIVVTGFATPMPVAGLLWHYAHYLLGFRALGHEVHYVEDSGDHPWNWDPVADDVDEDCRAGSTFLADGFGALGLGDRWVYRHRPTGRHDGLDAETTADVLSQADLLVSVSCTAPRRPEYEQIPLRIAIDTDPVFTQIKVAEGRPHWGELSEWHTRLFTFGRPPLPAQSHEWHPTRQPVDLTAWPEVGPVGTRATVTTVANWRSYPPVTWLGKEYGLKDRTLRKFLDLPATLPLPVTVALGPEPHREQGVAALRRAGWRVVDGYEVSRTTEAYRRFITGSAAGRPAVVQDTGWSDWLPHGTGLIPFTTAAQARQGLEEVLADPDGHARAARRIVAEQFDAAAVCAELLEACT